MQLHSRLLNSYIFLIVALAMLVAGCSLSFGPSNTPVQPTPTTLATVWNILEQRPLLIPPLSQNKSCPVTNGRVLPYVGFTPGHEAVAIRGTDVPYASPATLANGQPNPHNNGWYLQKVVLAIAIPNAGPVILRGHQIGGPHVLQFNGGLGQAYYSGDWANAPLLPEMQLMGISQTDGNEYGVGYTRAQVPGCYIYQIDGLHFSGYLIFQVVFGN